MHATTPRQQNLDDNSDRTIKKNLCSRDVESIVESEGTTASSSRPVNFFGQEVFQIVLHNPITSHQLTNFRQSRFCAENMTFLKKIDRYNILIDEPGTTMLDIHKNFPSINTPSQLHLSENVLTKMNKDLKSTLGSTLPKRKSLFIFAQHHTQDIVFSNIYPRFVRQQLVVTATEALAADRSKHAVLGDCLILTNLGKVDNSIVFASDGFVNVTGYPRNCRFLQGLHIDCETVTRLRMSIYSQEESVEMLSKYKKNKKLFWNLLYTAPL